jgi:hypothetical protein
VDFRRAKKIGCGKELKEEAKRVVWGVCTTAKRIDF